MRLQKKYGNSWAKITSFLPGRTDNAVKNRYWSATRSAARKSKVEKFRSYSSSSTSDDGETSSSESESDHFHEVTPTSSASGSAVQSPAESPVFGPVVTKMQPPCVELDLPPNLDLSLLSFDFGAPCSPSCTEVSSCSSSEEDELHDDILFDLFERSELHELLA